jgi:hypothetical protein
VIRAKLWSLARAVFAPWRAVKRARLHGIIRDGL